MHNEPYGAPHAPLYDEPGAKPSNDDTTWAMLSHLIVLVAGFIGPLVIYLVKKDESPFVAAHARDALNFQITVFIACLCCIPLIFVIVGIFLIPVISLGSLVCTILAAIEASKGRHYRYPLCLRIV